jgi:(5-formylfuran-3-yl)methyl phosphate synthase
MTQFLASVRDTAEAAVALGAGADIIDLKDPGRGALGAVDPKTIRACVATIAGYAAVSATIGDLPMDAGLVRDAVRATAACGVDHVKLGVFAGGDPRGCLELLRAEAREVSLILVLFADALPDFDAMSAAADIGARGVMLDTAGKDAGSLLDHLPADAIGRFVGAAKRKSLMVGLAGSLRAGHVAPLLEFQPDLMGFRGALCRRSVRCEAIDAIACRRIRALIPTEASQPRPQMREPHAAALC